VGPARMTPKEAPGVHVPGSLAATWAGTWARVCQNAPALWQGRQLLPSRTILAAHVTPRLFPWMPCLPAFTAESSRPRMGRTDGRQTIMVRSRCSSTRRAPWHGSVGGMGANGLREQGRVPPCSRVASISSNSNTLHICCVVVAVLAEYSTSLLQ
jgi:hypothetical protein